MCAAMSALMMQHCRAPQAIVRPWLQGLPEQGVHLRRDVLTFTDHTHCHHLTDLSHGCDHGYLELEKDAPSASWS